MGETENTSQQDIPALLRSYIQRQEGLIVAYEKALRELQKSGPARIGSTQKDASEVAAVSGPQGVLPRLEPANSSNDDVKGPASNAELEAAQQQIENALGYISSLEETLRAKDEEIRRHQLLVSDLSARLDTVHQSLAFRRFVRPMWRMRTMLAPHGSRRERLYLRVRRTAGGLLSGTIRPAQSAALADPIVNPPLSSPKPETSSIGDTASRPPEVSPHSDVVMTIISKNYLAHARALMHSVKAQHAELTLVTVLVDEIDGYFDPADEPFQILMAHDLAIPNWPHFSMKYDIMELNTAVKPYAIQYLMESLNVSRVVYFDPDILIYGSLDPLFRLLEQSLCVITPHITAPLNDDRLPAELDFLRVGTYNLGFFAISQNGDWRGLLSWWKDRLYENCTREVHRGLFVDQRWIDLVPGLFDGVHVLRDPNYNVAYWNLASRRMAVDESGNFTVNGAPLAFFHFSGFSVTNPESVSKHQNRFTFENLGAAEQRCYMEYRQRLIESGYETASTYPYAYSQFSDGVPITDALRICLRSNDSRGEHWPDPYRTKARDSFRDWATRPGSIRPYRILSPYALALFEMRSDLVAAFPQTLDGDEIGYASWFVQMTGSDRNFAPELTEPVRKALAGTIAQGQYDSGTAQASNSNGLSRIRKAIRYYRAFPTKVKPYLPAEAFSEPALLATSTGNLYGRMRDLLHRLGVLRKVKRMIGVRLVLTMREFFNASQAAQLTTGRAARQAAPGFSELRLRGEPVLPPAYGATIVGYLKAESGVGQIARNLVRCLSDVGFKVSGFVLDAGSAYRQFDESLGSFDPKANYFVQIFNVNADQAEIIYEQLGDAFYERHYNIGFWFWELAAFPDIWQGAFDLYDEIWTASTFVQRALQAKTDKPVHRIPVSIEVPLPEASSRAQFGLPEGCFTVLYVFDALSVIERKNPWAVIRAFEQAFSAEERSGSVKLVMKTTNLEGLPTEAERLRAELARVNGILIEAYLDRIEVNALIDQCDVYISLHRSEGYGLTIAEAMYLGKPVIATAYSGNVDFMNDEISYLIPYRLVKLGESFPPYDAQSSWAEPDEQEAAKALRHTYDQREEAAAKGQAAAAYIREHYNVRTRGSEIANRLKEILAQHGFDHPNVDTGGDIENP